jgi:uncharacterized membrane protein YfcA
LAHYLKKKFQLKILNLNPNAQDYPSLLVEREIVIKKAKKVYQRHLKLTLINLLVPTLILILVSLYGFLRSHLENNFPALIFGLLVLLTALALVINVWSEAALLYLLRVRKRNLKLFSFLWLASLLGVIISSEILLSVLPNAILITWAGLAIMLIVYTHLGKKILPFVKCLIDNPKVKFKAALTFTAAATLAITFFAFTPVGSTKLEAKADFQSSLLVLPNFREIVFETKEILLTAEELLRKSL